MDNQKKELIVEPSAPAYAVLVPEPQEPIIIHDYFHHKPPRPRSYSTSCCLTGAVVTAGLIIAWYLLSNQHIS